MARPYISIGRGGPRVGAVLGRRDMLGAGKFFVGFAVVIITMAALAHAGNLPDGAQLLIVIVGAILMLWLARRPYVPPMTAAEKEADFQATKARFNGG
jgi:membrane protein implicated in regulation of membrane protease activity